MPSRLLHPFLPIFIICATILFSIVAIYVYLFLLRRIFFQKRLEKISAFVKLNFIVWFLYLATQMPYMGFIFYLNLVFLITAKAIQYPPNLMFWSMLISLSVMPSISFTVLFLTLDRIFCISSPLNYDEKRRKMHFRFALFCMLIIGVITLCYYMADFQAMPNSSECLTFGCNFINGTLIVTYLKMIGGLMNVLSGILLLLKVRERKLNIAATQQNQIAAKKANKVVGLMVCTELMLGSLPQIAVFIINKTIGLVVQDYIGPYNMLLWAMDGLISASTFVWIFKRKLAKNTTHGGQEQYIKQQGNTVDCLKMQINQMQQRQQRITSHNLIPID